MCNTFWLSYFKLSKKYINLTDCRHAVNVCAGIWLACLVTTIPFWIYSTTTPFNRSQFNDINGSVLNNSSTSLSEPSLKSFTIENIPVEEYCKVAWPKIPVVGLNRFWAYFELVVGFVLPIVIMLVSYSLVVVRLLRNPISEGATNSGNKPRRPRSPKENSVTSRNACQRGRSNTKRVTIMIFIITIIFVLCWTPYHIYQLMAAHHEPTMALTAPLAVPPTTRAPILLPDDVTYDITDDYITTARPVVVINASVPAAWRPGSAYVVFNVIVQVLPFISSCCNPFIYYITSRNFREFIVF